MHRCSQVRNYMMPTFFQSPGKSLNNKILLTPQSNNNRTLGPSGVKPLLTVQRLPSNRMLDMEEELPPDQPQKVIARQISEDQPSDEVTVLNMNKDFPSYIEGVSISPGKQVVEEIKLQQPLSFIEYNIERLSALPVPLITESEELKVSIIDDQQRHSIDKVTSSEGGEDPYQYNKLDNLVTKVDQPVMSDETSAAELHQQHFYQTIQALEHIKGSFQEPPSIQVLKQYFGELIYLPDPWYPDTQKKVAIFDMDETLIHCVDDIERDSPDVVLEIDFSPDGSGSNPEDILCAGINIRPYWRECLEEASKSFQIVVFTASQQAYADAILNHLDPRGDIFQYRLYRQHCYLTPENYFVKDLRIIANRSLQDVVLIDNSVYSFAYQLTNGVPIVPFYKEPPIDEEMLHLIYYLSCLAGVQDVRVQNRQAFELEKLVDNINSGEQVVSSQRGNQIHEIKEEEEEDNEN